MEKSPRASPPARQLAGRVQKCNPFHPCGPARPGPYKSGQNRAGSKRAGLARFDIPKCGYKMGQEKMRPA